MKDLGKTIAKYRKEHKLNQSQLAKELENYDIYVKQNSISAWELGTATPNARQFLTLCEILEIYDIYTDFIGQSPLNPFRNLNENGMNKVLEYISDLESTGNYKPAEIIPIQNIHEDVPFPPVPALSLTATNMRCSPLLTFRKLQPSAYM